MTNLLLKTYIATQTTFSSLAENISFEPRSASETAREEHGAETVQVIMIMGIMAVIIGVIFLGPFGLKGTIQTLGENITGCVSKITGSSTAVCTW